MARARVAPLVGGGSRSGARAVRTAANAARDRGDCARAAGLYGRYLESVPTADGIWLQHGNMLKDAGLHAHAQRSYERAQALAPNDPEIRVQMAILAKMRGDFVAAARRYAEAVALGYANAAFLDSEAAFLRRSDSRRGMGLFAAGHEQQPCRIYLSSAAGGPPLETAKDLEKFLGATNYSYGFSMRGYLEALDQLDLAYEVIKAPEYIADIRQRGGAPANLHLGFYPPDKPRLLKGAYNVLVMAWEFERLRRASEQVGDHAFADPARMIGLADEVWMVSRFGAEAVARAGVESVSTVASPVLSGLADQPRSAPPRAHALYRASAHLEHIKWVPFAAGPFLSNTFWEAAKSRKTSLRTLLVETVDEESPVFFLSVLNVYDYRKQLKPLIEAFMRFSNKNRNAYLLIKGNYVDRDVGFINETVQHYQISGPSEIDPPLICDRIWLTDDILTRDELNRLYDMSAFYVSTAHGEGQNLPLIEAMGRGVVPVSVDHTAMRDYISEQDAVVIPSTFAPFDARLRAHYRMADLNTYYVAARDVHAALERAWGLDEATYAGLSDAAWNTVRAKFGLAPFRVAIEQLIERTRARFDSAASAS